MKRVLQLASYRRLLAAYTLNQLAWQIAMLSLAYLVYRRTGSAVGSAAFYLCAQFVPSLVAPALVARLDQLPVRRMLPILYGVEALAFLALAWVAKHFSLPSVLVLAIADGILAGTARALARAATVSVTSATGLLREGNAIANTMFSVCSMLGPALGGLMVVSGGASLPLLVDAALFAAMAVTLATARGLPGGVANPAPVAGRLRAALAHALDHRPIAVLLGIQAAALVFLLIPTPVEVVLARHSLRLGAGGYGALLSAWGAGAVLGSAAYLRWRALPSRRLLPVGSAALGAGFVAMALAPSLGLALPAFAIAGAGNGIYAVAARTALQEEVEERWMAMIMSLYESVYTAVPGVGILLGGLIGELAGPRPAIALAGAGTLAISVVWVIAMRPRDDEVLPALSGVEPHHEEELSSTAPR